MGDFLEASTSSLSSQSLTVGAHVITRIERSDNLMRKPPVFTFTASHSHERRGRSRGIHTGGRGLSHPLTRTPRASLAWGLLIIFSLQAIGLILLACYRFARCYGLTDCKDGRTYTSSYRSKTSRQLYGAPSGGNSCKHMKLRSEK